jgi:hypothetical protein
MLRLSSFFALFIVLWLGGPTARAQDVVFKNSGAKATLVELFSSEGCSSCPPAEAWVSQLKNSPALWTEVFPVVFHVDYWDGLGWPDRFAKAAYTERQRTYAARLGQDSVYTPEFVVSGREWRGWFNGERQPAAAMATRGELVLQVGAGGRKVTARYDAGAAAGAEMDTIHLALLGVNIRSEVTRGENEGRQLAHDFVVLDFQSAPLTSAPIELKPSTVDAPGALVGWVSDARGTIGQIAGGWLKQQQAAAGGF